MYFLVGFCALCTYLIPYLSFLSTFFLVNRFTNKVESYDLFFFYFDSNHSIMGKAMNKRMEVLMVTISEVAKEAGVSKATVSRILNHQGAFSEETIAKVLSTVKRLDYHPNEVARALGKNKSKTIALIFPTKDIPAFVEIESALEDAFYQKGYKVMLFNSLFNKEKEEDTALLLQNNMIDGIVIGSYTKDISHFANGNLPIVSAGRKIHDQIPYVKANDYSAGILAAKHLMSKDCKKILYLTNHPDGIQADERFAGFESELTKYNVNYWYYEITMDEQIRYNFTSTIHKMILEHPDADGLFVETDLLGMSCIQNYTKLGYKIPSDIKIIGYGDMFFSHLTTPALTTIKEDRTEYANTIANLLIDIVEGKEILTYGIELPVSLIERQST